MTVRDEKAAAGEAEIAVSPAVVVQQQDSSYAPMASVTPLASEPAPPPATGFAIDQPPERTVEVTAPSDMPGGYTFFVDSGHGTTYKVVVPAGGVTRMQRFTAKILEETQRSSHNVPHGQWRDKLGDCCSLGACHPSCCITCWFPFIGLGQVQTRMHLDWMGNFVQGKSSAFLVMVCISIVVYVVGGTLGGIIQAEVGNDQWTMPENDDEVEYESWVVLLVRIDQIFSTLVTVLFFGLVYRARQYIRLKYQIPEQSCDGCEDCCCAFWCGPCVVCQLARHTADYEQHGSSCCSDTGLLPNAPSVV